VSDQFIAWKITPADAERIKAESSKVFDLLKDSGLTPLEAFIALEITIGTMVSSVCDDAPDPMAARERMLTMIDKSIRQVAARGWELN
jgi:hypothetical protein